MLQSMRAIIFPKIWQTNSCWRYLTLPPPLVIQVELDEDVCSCLDCRLPEEIEDDHTEDCISEIEHSSDIGESNQDNEHDIACLCRYMSDDLVMCICDQINPDNLQPDDVEDSEEEELAADCLAEDCENESYRTCCDDPKHFEEPIDLEKWRNVFTAGDHGDIEDEEHFDTDEQVGMLYEPREPAVLLVSKEIRQQCLPIYYSQNTFSWRFVWTDYKRSCKRFKSWIKSISAENLKLMTRITFQCRHVVEEGVEMSLDIDLLPYHPYFETNAYADEDHEIAEAMNRETAAYLWLMAQSERARPKLSVGHFCELANIFVQAMFR